ncbi:tetratricopeptide repeat protein [candidate division TA06 bacterium]|uniref:Tetratricopeptide repeat protein n=1 Tax=candidate division TA06 bacterium TaxID=2250710 RepID=A0A523UV22_UNCT6|nr:MAG: tetratricopeptide repeat protein [candidate division TA06 bacterium]
MKLILGVAASVVLIIGCATTQVPKVTETETAEQEPCKRYYDFGFEYLKNGSYDDAIVNFQRAVDCSTDYVEALIGLSQSYAQKGDMDSAESVLARAVVDVPGNPDIYCFYGHLCIDKKEFERAAEHYMMALSIDSLNFNALFGIGYTYHKMGELEKAIGYYRRAKAIDPEDTACRFKLGEALMELGRYDEALAELEYVVDIHPDDLEARVTLAETYMNPKVKKYGKALVQFQAIVEKQPDDIQGLLGVGRASAKLKKYNTAEQAFNRARSIAPDDPAPLYYLAEMYMARKRLSSVRKLLDEALAASFSSKVPFQVLYGDLYFKYGYSYYNDGENEQSIDMYEKSIKKYRKAVNDRTYSGYANNQIKRAKARIENIRLEEEGF